jgi:hypothetical protein
MQLEVIVATCVMVVNNDARADLAGVEEVCGRLRRLYGRHSHGWQQAPPLVGPRRDL